MTQFVSLAAPLGRTALVGIFPLSALSKLGAVEATQGYMASVGLPGFLIFPTIGFEILAPLAVIAGFYSRVAAFLLAGFSVVTALTFHFDFADQIQSIMFMKNIAIAGGLLLLARFGPGSFAINEK